MDKKVILLIFLVLFLSIGVVSAEDTNLTVENQTLNNFNDNHVLAVEAQNNAFLTTQAEKNPVSKLVGSDVSSVYGKQAKISVKVLNKNKKVIKNKLVTFKINNDNYSSYSNSKGIASINLKLNAGKYTVTYSADGITSSSNIIVKNSYKITIYKWKTGANVYKNYKIKKNSPNSKLVKKIVKAAKKGTPLIRFKGGDGKKVFITAGVHGNELSSQIAALKLIKHLENHPVKGTVYIMPFVNPKATAKNVRNTNYNLNSKANVKGTISYKTVKLITDFKCDAYGDFHCTQPGGVPGKNVAMGSFHPTENSAVMAKYISKKANVKSIIYDLAGDEYPGALEDAVNLKGIPAVTCEVVTPHGKIAKGSVATSLLMMKSLLKFSQLI